MHLGGTALHLKGGFEKGPSKRGSHDVLESLNPDLGAIKRCAQNENMMNLRNMTFRYEADISLECLVVMF